MDELVAALANEPGNLQRLLSVLESLAHRTNVLIEMEQNALRQRQYDAMAKRCVALATQDTRERYWRFEVVKLALTLEPDDCSRLVDLWQEEVELLEQDERDHAAEDTRKRADD